MRKSERQAEVRFVEDALGDSIICERCGAKLATYADKCSAELDDACPGFLAIDRAKLAFNTAKTLFPRALRSRLPTRQDAHTGPSTSIPTKRV